MKSKIIKLLNGILYCVYLAVFSVGLITIYNYTAENFPKMWSFITTSILIIGAVWYFRDVILKHFLEGYRNGDDRTGK